jgi:hypothetical protein
VRLRGFKANSLTFLEFKEHFEKKLCLKKTQGVLLKKNQKMQYLAMEKRILLNSYDKRIFDEKKTRTKPVSFYYKNANTAAEGVEPLFFF